MNEVLHTLILMASIYDSNSYVSNISISRSSDKRHKKFVFMTLIFLHVESVSLPERLYVQSPKYWEIIFEQQISENEYNNTLIQARFIS